MLQYAFQFSVKQFKTSNEGRPKPKTRMNVFTVNGIRSEEERGRAIFALFRRFLACRLRSGKTSFHDNFILSLSSCYWWASLP